MDLRSGSNSEVFPGDSGDSGRTCYYRFSPQGGKVSVEVWESGMRWGLFVLDRQAGNRIIQHIPNGRGCVWTSESVLHFLRFSGDDALEHVWDLSWPEPKLVKSPRDFRGEAYLHYLSSHFSDGIRALERAFDDPTVAGALPPPAFWEESLSPAVWYLRSENIFLWPPLVKPAPCVGFVGPSACVSPGAKWLATSDSEAEGIQIIPLASSRATGAEHLISPTPERSLDITMSWLPDDRHLLFVERERDWSDPDHDRESVWVYDTKTRRKQLLTEGESPAFVPHLGNQP